MDAMSYGNSSWALNPPIPWVAGGDSLATFSIRPGYRWSRRLAGSKPSPIQVTFPDPSPPGVKIKKALVVARAFMVCMAMWKGLTEWADDHHNFSLNPDDIGVIDINRLHGRVGGL